MTRSLLRMLALLAVTAANAGCLTSAVNQLGRRVPSYQRPVRAVVLTDDRVVVDYAQFDRRENSAPAEWSFKRVVYRPELFQTAAAEGSPPAPGAPIEEQVFRFLAVTPAEKEPGDWVPVMTRPLELPTISGLDPEGPCGSTREMEHDRSLAVCDERSGRALRRDVNLQRVDLVDWWFYPARLLFVPAVAGDVVTAPFQAVFFLVFLRAGLGH